MSVLSEHNLSALSARYKEELAKFTKATQKSQGIWVSLVLARAGCEVHKMSSMKQGERA